MYDNSDSTDNFGQGNGGEIHRQPRLKWRGWRRVRRAANSNAYVVYLCIEAAFALFGGMYGSLTTVYRIKAAGLNPLQLVLIGTALEGSIFLLQVPTGVLADVFSRRRSVIIGVALTGLGFLLEGSFPIFWTILLAQVLWGAGYTFISGAEEAWIADEVGTETAGKAYLRATQVGQAAGILGLVIGVVLGSLRLNLPMVVAGVCVLILSVALIFFMPETRAQATAAGATGDSATTIATVEMVEQRERAALGDLWRTLQSGLRLVWRRPILLTILGIGVFFGMSSEGYDRLGDAHILTDFHLPPLGPFSYVYWFGILDLVSALLSLTVVEVIRRRLNTNSHRSVSRMLFALNGLLMAGVIGFGLARLFALALALYWAVRVIRNVSSPLFTAWINQGVDSSVRATIISMEGQADAFGQIAGGPVVGAIGLYVSLRAALVAAGLTLSPALLLFVRSFRQGSKDAHPETDAIKSVESVVGETPKSSDVVVAER